MSTYLLDGHLSWSEMSRKSGGEVPGQQSLKLVDRMVGDAFEDMAQVEFRVESVELRRTEQAVDGRSTLATGVRASEEVVLATQSNGAQGAFRRGVVHLDAAIVDVAGERTPAGERIANRECSIGLP